MHTCRPANCHRSLICQAADSNGGFRPIHREVEIEALEREERGGEGEKGEKDGMVRAGKGESAEMRDNRERERER